MRDGGRVTDAVIIGCCNLIADGDRYLLVKEAKASARSRYNLPAGKPEVGETLTEAAVREAREETGLTVAIDHLVGIYHCPKASEGFGVVNFVFAVRPLAGTLATSPTHPDVRYFSRVEIAALAAEGMVRGTHIERAIDDHAAGRALPLSIIEVVTASSFPIVA
jgi:ADP-ribose pyrophosphatase YjhB (NUDIX family)